MGEFIGTDEQLVNALRAMPIRGGISGQVIAQAAADKIEAWGQYIDQLEQDLSEARDNADSSYQRGYWARGRGECSTYYYP